MNNPIKLDLDAIEAAAKAATQGQWTFDQFRMGGVVRGGPVQHWVNGSGQSQIAMSTGAEWMEHGETDANAKHMATANPTVVLELVRRLRAAEALSAARIVEVPKGIAAVALVGEFKPAYVQEMKAFHDALREQHGSSALVLCVQSPTDLQAFDEEQMRVAGWVRA